MTEDKKAEPACKPDCKTCEKPKMGHVLSKDKEHQWFYNDVVKDHFFHPRNILKNDKDSDKYAAEADGVGFIGSPVCGDGMKIFIKIDKRDDRIIECKWQTFGCATAIASTSMFSTMLTENGGMKIDDALGIHPKEIAERLGGIPVRKFHCSVLADKAFKDAINDYFKKSGQEERIKTEKVEIVDKILKITDNDIEHAVLEGAVTLEDVQQKTKVGIHDKECIPRVEELIEIYKKKYFG